MKKIASFILAFCLLFGLTAPTAGATSIDITSAQQTVQALGIIVGDEAGNMNLSGDVNRAQFAKMMIAASAFKDTISSTAKSSPFKDVKYSHWAASYVQAAVSSGWLTGFTDGTYKPDNNVKLEEAVSAVLKMLGYPTTDFTGSFPEAQLAKYTALGLNENITKTQGQALSRQDCMYLFYNLMGTKTKSNVYYATTLGYTVNGSGELDYSSLVMNNMKGPFIVDGTNWNSALPFTASTAKVYKNGSLSSISSVSTYDVYYYNTSMKTVWVYRNNVTGVYAAATPSTSAPSSVTVAGKTYPVSTSSASYALSTTGSFKIGDTVTLLLGMNGDVVGVVSSSSVSSTKFGFVTATGSKSYTDNLGNTYSSSTVTVACTDGGTYEYDCTSSSFVKGSLVKISVSGGKASVSLLNDTPLSGTVNSSATTFATYTFSEDVQILDSSLSGTCIKVYPARLAGLNLSNSNVRYYALDASGKINTLILNNVTGDMYKYGVLTSATESNGEMSISSSYNYIIDGVSGSYSSSSSSFGATTGPVQMEFRGDELMKLSNLSRISISTLNVSYAESNGIQYKLGDNVSVYIYKNGSYNLSSVSSVSNSSSYSLSGYYDKPISEGGRIRVIIANENWN